MRNRAPHVRRISVLLVACIAGVCAACAGSTVGEGFGIVDIDVAHDAVWQINRPIRIEFTQPVDFKTVSLNTIQVREVGGGPCVGEFHLDAPHVVVFQPRCPTLDDLSDAGLAPGGVHYELNVLGGDGNLPLTVRSSAGEALAQGVQRSFVTPLSTQPLELYFDSDVGPPQPIVRGPSPADQCLDACHIELGSDPLQRVYFRVDDTGIGALDPLQSLPLNRHSAGAEHVALVLHFDQAVDPGAANISSARLAWQFDAAPAGAAPQWTDLATQVELVANCTQSGALVRIEPLGILPPHTDLRVVVAPQFSDLVGQTNLLLQADFARSDSVPAPAPLTDELLERYADAGGLDPDAGFAEPPALVQAGKLSAAFSFTGTGGVGGEFDWRVPAGQTLIFSTDSQIIVGGPGFAPQHNVAVLGGMVDVRNLRIEAGGTLKVQGTQPLTIQASGKVEILGTLDIRGTDSQGVVTLHTTSIPEVGAPGAAGGGRGGTGSPLTTSSSPKGGNGWGAFGAADGGGTGGETGWTNFHQNFESRRGAGGGGGTLGASQPWTGAPEFGTWEQSFLGLDAESGFPNLSEKAHGASSGLPGPFGGASGARPFSDSSSDNDFWGHAVVGELLIEGELPKPWAGAGGGAGGDAAFVPGGKVFPAVPFNPQGDEKGGSGGGGGGSLQILALGDIVLGANGRILCRGGSGGGGENTGNTNRVGGAGGGGSGGHVILQTAGVIDLSQCAGPSTAPGSLGTLLGGILATGGQGGAGAWDEGGAWLDETGKHDTEPHLDGCPPGYPAGGELNGCAGHFDGAGGDGGPGIVQLHTPDGLASVLLPPGKTLGDVCKPRPLFWDGDGRLAPTFGRTSRAQSAWIALGEGGFQESGGTFGDVSLRLEGTDPATGRVLGDGAGGVLLLPALLPTATLVAAPGVPSITAPRTLVLHAAGIDATYAHLLDDPAQMEGFLVRLGQGGSAVKVQVAAASYDAATQVLTLETDSAAPPLAGAHPPGKPVSLHPAWFRVHSDGAPDVLPESSAITILVEATLADPLTGLPDPQARTGFESDVAVLDAHPQNAQFRYLRYQVLFDLAATGGALTASAPVPALDFLRLPFRYE
jgi:hypothetical protein